jgi:hypothetical protein
MHNHSYFQHMLYLFYTRYVLLPTTNDSVAPEIHQNLKFWPYFKDALGAIDSSHILPQLSNCPTETAKVVFFRTVCLDAHLICNLSMPILGRRDQQRTHKFMKVLLRMG